MGLNLTPDQPSLCIFYYWQQTVSSCSSSPPVCSLGWVQWSSLAINCRIAFSFTVTQSAFPLNRQHHLPTSCGCGSETGGFLCQKHNVSFKVIPSGRLRKYWQRHICCAALMIGASCSSGMSSNLWLGFYCLLGTVFFPV